MTTTTAPPVRPCIGAHQTFDLALHRPQGASRDAVRRAKEAAASMCGRCPARCDQPVELPAKRRAPVAVPKAAKIPKPPKPKAVKPPRPPRLPAEPRPHRKRPDTCGTPTGHIRHGHRHEPVCNPCQTARLATIPHGTLPGYMRHRRYNDDPCQACRDACRDAANARSRAISEKRAPCGTEAGHTRHIRYREPACGDCTAAHAQHGADLREQLRIAERSAATKQDRNKAARLRYRLTAITQPELVPHGTSTGYCDYGCRCEPCLEAGHEIAMRRRDRATATAA